MNKIIFFGIDPGKTGAIAWLVADVVAKKIIYASVTDLKCCKVSPTSKKVELDPLELKETIRTACNDAAMCTNQSKTVLEHVWARPSGRGGAQDSGIVSAASITNSMTCCKTVLKMMDMDFQLVVPQSWKKHFGIVSDKERARLYAIERFPACGGLLKFKKNTDRAEALLMALYGYETYLVENG